jgi:hypothetical protein
MVSVARDGLRRPLYFIVIYNGGGNRMGRLSRDSQATQRIKATEQSVSVGCSVIACASTDRRRRTRWGLSLSPLRGFVPLEVATS